MSAMERKRSKQKCSNRPQAFNHIRWETSKNPMKKKLRLFKRRRLPESTWITSTTGTQSSLQKPWYATAFQAPVIQLPEYSGPCRAPACSTPLQRQLPAGTWVKCVGQHTLLRTLVQTVPSLMLQQQTSLSKLQKLSTLKPVLGKRMEEGTKDMRMLCALKVQDIFFQQVANVLTRTRV